MIMIHMSCSCISLYLSTSHPSPWHYYIHCWFKKSCALFQVVLWCSYASCKPLTVSTISVVNGHLAFASLYNDIDDNRWAYPLHLWIPPHLCCCIYRVCGLLVSAVRRAKQMIVSHHLRYPVSFLLLVTSAHDVMMHARHMFYDSHVLLL